MKQEIVIDYRPRAAFDAFHARSQRWAEIICHRRAGKTVAAVNDLQKRCVQCPLPYPRFAFMAPSRVRAKDIAWQYLKRFAEPIPGVKIHESELFVEYPNKGRVTLYGADNDRGMGLYLDGIVFDECDEIPPSVDDVIEPALADRKGWTVHMGILRGRHNLFKRFEKHRNDPRYFQMMLKASESNILDPSELATLRERMGEVAFELQMECNASMSIANAIYGHQMDQVRQQNRIRPLNPDPSVPLLTFWDIGHSDRGDDWTIWLAQLVANEIILLDYHAHTGEVPAYYAAKVREWEDKYRQRVAMNYLPHDGERRNQVGKSARDYLRDAGLERIKIVPRTPKLWDSIHELRALFPRIYINQKPCAETWFIGELEMPSGIDCLDYYSKKEEADTGYLQDVPVHDQYSHGADALRTLAEASRQGMIEGTSFVARENRGRPVNVMRGPGPTSYGKPRRNVHVTR